MKTILVPTDFSEQAENALDLASQIAQKQEGKIILLNVIEPIKSYVAATDGMYIDTSVEQKYIDYLKDNAKNHLDGLIKKFPHVQIEPRVTLGPIFSSINEVIASHQATLIVMGTQGVSGLDELLIGSNTEKVVRTATCPVLTVRGKLENITLKDIAFATDFNAAHVKIVEDLKQYQAFFGSHIHLLFVNVPNDFSTHRDIVRKKNQFVEQSGLENYTFHVYDEINEENGIIYFAEDNDMDMIVVATRQRTGLAHLISGSIAEDVVNHADRPVMTFGTKYLKKHQEA